MNLFLNEIATQNKNENTEAILNELAMNSKYPVNSCMECQLRKKDFTSTKVSDKENIAPMLEERKYTSSPQKEINVANSSKRNTPRQFDKRDENSSAFFLNAQPNSLKIPTVNVEKTAKNCALLVKQPFQKTNTF